MKRKKITRFLVSIMLFVALATGCKEYLKYTITTRIRPNGSIERTLLIEGGDSTLLKGDYSSVMKGSLPVPHDTTWDITTGRDIRSAPDTTLDTIYYYKAVKVFHDDDALNRELNRDTLMENNVTRQVKVEKRFRWFNTFYRYAETYKQIFPFVRIPVTDYLSEVELKLYHANDDEIYYSPETNELLLGKDTLKRNALSKTDSINMKKIRDSIEKKYEEWLFASIFEDFFEVIKEALDKSGTMKPEDTEKTRESFYALYKTNPDSIFDYDSCDFPMLRLASTFYKVDTGILHQANRKNLDAFNAKLLIFLGSDVGESFTNLAIMPGVIISSNSTKINGNTASWEFDSDEFNERDYTLLVESKKANKGPVIVTGALVLMLLLGLTAGMVRRK
jgi:hypothetical protein